MHQLLNHMENFKRTDSMKYWKRLRIQLRIRLRMQLRMARELNRVKKRLFGRYNGEKYVALESRLKETQAKKNRQVAKENSGVCELKSKRRAAAASKRKRTVERVI
jgi:hypothetical protein